MQRKVKTISFKGQDIYVGIDVHLKSWVVTIMLEEVVHKTFSQDPDANKLFAYLQKYFPGGNYHSIYEAGFCGFSIHRELTRVGIHNIVVNPADIPTTDKERKQKEDRRDSRKLARSLRNKEVEGIYVPSQTLEELRGLVRYRKTLSRELGRHKNRIKSYLYYNGIKIPVELNSASKYWSRQFTSWLSRLELSTPQGTMVIKETLDTAEFLRHKLLFITRELRKLNKDSAYSKLLSLLQGIPGIGFITALTILTELVTITRFRSLDQLCSYFGLVPTTNSSGDKDKVGSITKRANSLLRVSIIEAAWIAIRYDPALSLKYVELRSRMEPQCAIIRIAKKLLNRIRFVIKNEQEYVCSVI
ncbi:IS110 family transposase [Carboxylicivirga sp. RSCT41]|uniref:IS110 family transposase n=1 Tax=Carboxylicivirga agarovorans TaxID=3417570 RepID=UPI003D33FB41